MNGYQAEMQAWAELEWALAVKREIWAYERAIMIRRAALELLLN